jgi:AbrB family looped-hinge helix DNA binding protein
MTTKLTLDKAGRVVIPKPLRDELNLGPGDALQLEAEGEQIILRPLRGVIPLRKERGLWVYRTGQTLSASISDDTLRKVRKERDQQNLGKLS